MSSRAQIIVTLGPASEGKEIFLEMARHQADLARLNFSWGNYDEKTAQIETVRTAEKKLGKKIPIIIDLPGPRIQKGNNHEYDKSNHSSVPEKDIKHIRFGIEQRVDFIALSFVGSKNDILKYREVIKNMGGNQKIIAKIERRSAVENFDEILEASDAIMIARGDLGNEFPLEQIPFIQATIIEKCNRAKKPVITATQMLLSMTLNPTPTRAEVTDVNDAILSGSDAVMLSEETATGKYPLETVVMMEKIVVEAEKHLRGMRHINPLT
ncbi:MAG: pyruvate kinase [bacterium]|nr:pyruvate kinase [bacterium]